MMERAMFQGVKLLKNVARKLSPDMKTAVCASAEGEAKLPPTTVAMPVVSNRALTCEERKAERA